MRQSKRSIQFPWLRASALITGLGASLGVGVVDGALSGQGVTSVAYAQTDDSSDASDSGERPADGAGEEAQTPATPQEAPAPKATPAAKPKKAPGASPAPSATPVAPATAPKAAATPAAEGATAPKDAVPGAKPTEAKEPTPEEIAKTWHDKTPPTLARRVFLGATLGIGVGTGPKDGYSSDRLAAQLFGQYALGAPVAAGAPPAPALRWVVETQYAASTGVEVDDDESLSTQAFLVGGGMDYRLGSTTPVEDVRALPTTSKDRMRLQAIGLVGATKTLRLSLETGGRPASRYGANVGVDLRYLHLVSDRIEACVGLGARAVGYSWYALNFGLVGSF